MADATLFEMTADIVASYVGQNKVAPEEIPELIRATYQSLHDVKSGRAAADTAPVKLTPAVPIKKSIQPDYLISLEDGKRYKSLKRHLRTKYDMSPEEYRAKWGLPKDYPMVAPNYAAARSELARSMGLGRGGAGARKPAKPARGRKAPTGS